MNTGIQRSSATPLGAWTTTTPKEFSKRERKKNIMEILAAHRIPYIATASVAYPDDMIAKIRKAKEIHGTRFIHVFSPCPPGWKFEPEDSIKISRLAIESKMFPLVEIFDGVDFRLSLEPAGIPIEQYLKTQGRFKHLKEKDMEAIQQNVDESWERLMSRVNRGRPADGRKNGPRQRTYPVKSLKPKAEWWHVSELETATR